MILRTLFRHLLVLYVFLTVYCVHRNKLFGYCNPMKFVESRDCALMKERSLLLLADKDANLAGYERTRNDRDNQRRKRRICHYIQPI